MDRDYWGSELGNYFLCAQAYDTYSAYASVQDELFGGVFNADKITEYHMNLHTNNGYQFRYR